jgi:mRNA interferase MazF
MAQDFGFPWTLKTNSKAGLATEVGAGAEEGLKHPSVINCDQLTRLEKSVLTEYIGMLSSKKRSELRAALRVALSVD